MILIRMIYIIEELNWYSIGTEEVLSYLDEMLVKLSKMYGRNLNGTSFYRYLQEGGRICVCKLNGEIKGVSMVSMKRSIWDSGKVIVYQDLLYGDIPKASYYLFDDMIDFAKSNADAMMTMTTEHIKINEMRLLKKGFKKLETNYLLEV